MKSFKELMIEKADERKPHKLKAGNKRRFVIVGISMPDHNDSGKDKWLYYQGQIDGFKTPRWTEDWSFAEVYPTLKSAYNRCKIMKTRESMFELHKEHIIELSVAECKMSASITHTHETVYIGTPDNDDE